MGEKKKNKFCYEFPRPSLTVDVAVMTREQPFRVLLIRRKAEPFAGKWALPGGFVNENECLTDAACRELKEECGVEQVDLEQVYTFGDPGRDPRGWTVSVVYLARVPAEKVVPVAGDDAAEVRWFPLDALPPLAFDHAQVLARVRERIAGQKITVTGSSPGT
jgi:8-oxo-dGTP diphosphatase